MQWSSMQCSAVQCQHTLLSCQLCPAYCDTLADVTLAKKGEISVEGKTQITEGQGFKFGTIEMLQKFIVIKAK